MSQPPGGSEPRYSDDRQWWWDGQKWVPAAQAPQAQPAAPQPAAAAKRGQVPGWLAVVGLVLCFPAGIVLTLFTNWSARTKGIAIGVVAALAVVGVVASAAASPKTTPSGSISASTPSTATSTQPKPSSSAPKSPVASPKPHFLTFGDGTHVVGKDVQPGTYRAPKAALGCYFARLKGFSGQLDDIIANEDPTGPSVVTIAASDAGFQSNGCGTWTSDLSAISRSQTSFGEGDYVVGVDIQPGTYQDSGGNGCYWARLSGFGHTLDEVIANDNPSGQAVVAIAASDKGFENSHCGTWTKVG